MSDVYYGTVIWFKKTFGFIAWEKDGEPQNDLFCHYSDIASAGFKTLYKDQKVSFKLGANNSGNPKAIEVSVLKN